MHVSLISTHRLLCCSCKGSVSQPRRADHTGNRWIRALSGDRQAASFFCFNVKASATIRALLSVRASARGARARGRTVGCSPYPAPTRIESNSSARVRILAEGHRRLRPFPSSSLPPLILYQPSLSVPFLTLNPSFTLAK